MSYLLEIEIKLLREENEKLKAEIAKYKSNHKKYYNQNKDAIIGRANERLKKLAKENPEVLKEYRKKAYQRRKERIKTEENAATQQTESIA